MCRHWKPTEKRLQEAFTEKLHVGRGLNCVVLHDHQQAAGTSCPVTSELVVLALSP